MAIIYTYPTKETPANDDLILISDSADSNKTKQVKVSSLPGGSSSGVTQIIAGNNVTIDPVNGLGTVTVNAAGGGSTSPGGSNTQVQFNNSGAFDGSADLTFATNTLAVKHTVDIKGQGQNLPAGKLKLNCEMNTHAVTIEGPIHNNSGGNYTLKLPSLVPQNNQILQFTSAGNLGWINTPTGITYSAGTGLALNTTTFSLAAGLDDLSDVSFSATANGSLYVGQISSQLSGTPAGNVTLGGGAAKVATTAYDNTIIGSDAAVAITEGSNNVILGSDSTAVLTTGDDNVVIGSDVAPTMSTGTDNVIIGKGADIGASGARSVIIGEGASGNNESIAIGQGVAVGNNELGIGEIALPTTGWENQTYYLPIKIKNSNGQMVQYYIKLWT